ncbi:MAG: sodium:proton antiporter [Polyangiales bacterium]
MHLNLPVAIGLLVAATAVAITAKRAQVPYNVALVVGGMLIAVSGLLPAVPHLDPDVVFLVCLPALIFEGGITADLGNIRANASPIALLSTVGMLLAIGATGAALHFTLGLAWGPALLLGVILAVTDTVSILYAFRRVAVPSRLAGIMEGESLFNDGTALVMYGAVVDVVSRGAAVAVPALAARAVLATVGGLAVGLAMGLGVAFVIRRTVDPLAEIMATSALAYASYTAAEELHVSGVIAVVTAGLTIGTALRRDVAPQSRVAINSFWEYAAFGVNTFLFLSVGLATHPRSLLGHFNETAVAVACVFAGRAVAIYLPFLALRLARPALAVPFRWQHVFVLGNIKGALSIALALGLPPSTPSRELLVDAAFGVTFVSLVAQGLMLPRVLRGLGLVREEPGDAIVAAQQGRLVGARAARQELEILYAAGLVPRAGYDQLRGECQVVIAAAERELRRLQEAHLAHGARAVLAARRRLLDAERTAVVGARRAGLLPEAAAEELLAEADERLLALEHALAAGDAPPAPPPHRPTQGGHS